MRQVDDIENPEDQREAHRVDGIQRTACHAVHDVLGKKDRIGEEREVHAVPALLEQDEPSVPDRERHAGVHGVAVLVKGELPQRPVPAADGRK